MYDKEVRKLFDRLSIFEKMFQVIRFVDPTSKKVLSFKNNKVSDTDARCFDFWGKNKICDNCISIRAFNENKTFVKVEYAPGKIFVVTAVPFELTDRRIVIELLNDSTDSLIYENVQHGNASEVYSMIDNMNNLALRDPLTGVYNKRYINERLPIDLMNAMFSEQDVSIVMADIDFFKKVNDTYGHLAGDEVLKSFTNTLCECIKRESDWVARFGGEEFLICLSGAGVDKAAEIAEKMRIEVESKEILWDKNIIRITSSFGICTMKPVLGTKSESIIECADKKLYAAKNNGRNRVEY